MAVHLVQKYIAIQLYMYITEFNSLFIIPRLPTILLSFSLTGAPVVCENYLDI